MSDNILVIGGGGREHALVWKLSQSPRVKHVFVAVGNAGIQKTSKTSNIALDVKDHSYVAKWCKENNIELVVVGPEDPLANGIADSLSVAGIKCFGPSQKAAQIESSKSFAKSFMDRHNIPTARWQSFTDPEEAKQFILNAPYEALVVKASGLAAGKGVIVASSRQEAVKAVDSMMQDKTLSKAGEVIVIEELLQGEEVSVLAFTDGTTVALMPPAQDHKRLLDGDKGPNTGGMGAYCPCPQVSKTVVEGIKKNIIQRATDGMRKEGTPYIGVLYAGLMLTEDGAKVLEFNCRFGDPECQVILPLLSCDLYTVLLNCVNGKLKEDDISWRENSYAVAVVLASQGYPGSYPKGKEITGLDAANNIGTVVFHAGTSLKDNKIVTSGGRVLAVVGISSSLQSAVELANHGAEIVNFEGAFHRKDIAHRAIHRKKGLTYKDSGVDINAGDQLVEKIKLLADATKRSGVVGSIGGFGGVFDTKLAGYDNPLLVSGTDGVGTKLKIAQECNIHNTIGIDLVAMCVNDILTQGAEPLFFLDYFSTGKLDPVVAGDVIEGITAGCQYADCALLGGETAEMPGMYAPGDYDLAGFAVGAVERRHLLPRVAIISEGDVLIGLPSSGLHSNGFSLVRKVVEMNQLKYCDPSPFEENKTLAQSLLTPTKIYVKLLLPILRSGYVKAAAHITGGGLTENIPRVLPPRCQAELDASSWPSLPVFSWLSKTGNISHDEMLRTFNCGLGMVLIVSGLYQNMVTDALVEAGEKPLVVGTVKRAVEGDKRVTVLNFEENINKPQQQKKKVGVLISGSGTNLQSLIDHTVDPYKQSSAEIVLVISNVPDVEGLKRAQRANIPTKVISHKKFSSRESFDMEVHKALTEAGVEIVCLAGFMRIVSGKFVELWRGHLLNIHPSLLPSFPGAHAHRDALASGVKVTGCTVHFVEPDVDAGAIIAQEAVDVKLNDTVKILQERVKLSEHKIYPYALELLASGRISLENKKIVWNLKGKA